MSQLGLISKQEIFIVQGTSHAIQPTSWSHYSREATLEKAREKCAEWQAARPEIKDWRIVKATEILLHEVAEIIK